MRWEEELNLTKHEMVWSTGYFIHQMTQWENRRDMAAAPGHPGPLAYAERQIHKWRMLAANADAHYVKLFPAYSTLV
jgi:hypothetical protein